MGSEGREGREAGPEGAPRPGPRPWFRPRGPFLPRTRRARLALSVLVALTVLVGGGTWVLYGTGLLQARGLTVTGTDVLSADEVREAAAVPLPQPLAGVDTDAVERRLLDRLPRIDHVDVERSWPHTLRLEVTERQPVAVLKRKRGFTEVDKDGTRYADVSEVPKSVPVVELLVDRSKPEQAAGLRHFGTSRLLRSAIRVAADLPAAVRRETRVIEVHSFDGIRLRLSGERTVVWGSSELGARKAKALTAVMRADKDAGRYDVSAPSAPASGG